MLVLEKSIFYLQECPRSSNISTILNQYLFWLTYVSSLLSVVPLFVICKALTKMFNSSWTQLISSSWRRYKNQDPQFPKVGTSNLWASETVQADWILVQSFMFNILVSKNPVMAWVPSQDSGKEMFPKEYLIFPIIRVHSAALPVFFMFLFCHIFNIPATNFFRYCTGNLVTPHFTSGIT